MARNNLVRLVVVLGLAILVATGLSRISFNIDILKLLPARLPQVEGLSLFLRHFSQPDELIITLDAPDAETASNASRALAARLQSRPDLVRRAVAEAPWEKNPADLAELLAVLLLNQPPADLRATLDRFSPAHATETLRGTLDRLDDSLSPSEMALLSHDPYGLVQSLPVAHFATGEQSEFASPDGTFRVIYVEAARKPVNYRETIAWIREIKALTGTWHSTRTEGPVTLGFTGEPAFVAEISGSMQWDMQSSGFLTLLIIATVFWLCYRRARPLFDLQAMLLLTFVISLALAGLFLHQLTVIGVGYASIMIGLSVDYGYFIHQKSLRHTGTLRALQWECLQNIAWTAGTTAAAFFALNLSSLPGLSQLGNLVGIGVLTGAAVMLLVFAPLAMRWKKIAPAPVLAERLLVSPHFIRIGTGLTIALVLLLGGALVWKGWPPMDATTRSLQPRHSEANAAMDQLSARLANDPDLLSLVVSGSTETQVLQRLQALETRLQAAQARGELVSYRSPLALWPEPENQRQNLAAVQSLVADMPRLRQTLLAAGFTDESFALTEVILRQWTAWSGRQTPIWPENESSRWIYRHVASRGDGQFLALGLVHPVPGRIDALTDAVQGDGVWLTGWNQLGRELHQIIPGEFQKLLLGLGGSVLVLLFFAFGGVRDVLVLVATMSLVLLSLVGAMALLGLEWNFFNLAALLLLLGTGIDYSILLLLALRRNGGSIVAARQSLGLVICLCAGSAAAGFGTISWASNQGLASLGQTCSLGLALDALITLFLLPLLWQISRGRFPWGAGK